jgi:DNA-binding transcriptional ArsR family regulator
LGEQSKGFGGEVKWEMGTGYDLLVSAYVLHRPREYGLPAPWAAGVRGRLSPEGRAALKEFFGGAVSYGFTLPLHIVHQLPPPRDAAAVIEALKLIPGDQFIHETHHPFDSSSEDDEEFGILLQALDGSPLRPAEREKLQRWFTKDMKRKLAAPEIDVLLDMFANQAEVKERYVAALEEYYRVYFADEEQRSEPILAEALAQAQAEAAYRSPLDVLEQLSHGFTFSASISTLRRITIVPSFWTKPWVFQYSLSTDEVLLLYGARPEWARLVPGEAVPDAAIRTLKTLADPTRLRLLRLLAEQPRAPQEMAREIKLSLPTILHHLHELRLAGLVRLEVGDKGERMYYLRWQEAEDALNDVRGFVKQTEG